MLYIARFCSGFSTGMVFYSVLPLYLCEIASDNIRGTVSIILPLLSKVGILFVYTIGPLVTLPQMAWINIGSVILFLLLFVWMPESPHYLAGKKNIESALSSLSKLRGHTNVNGELQKIIEAIQISKKHNSSFKEIFNAGNTRSFMVAVGLSLAMILCGGQPILAYSQLIFDQIEHSILSSSQTNIIFGTILLISAIIATGIIDCIGRRPLLLSSAVVMLVTNIIVSIYFELKQNNMNIDNLAWLPTTMLMIFIFGYGIGLATVGMVIIGEIFPKHIKAGATAVCAMVSSAFSFGFYKLFQFLSDDYGYNYSFWMFSFFSLLLIPFVWFLVPETNGKSLGKILQELNAGNRK